MSTTVELWGGPKDGIEMAVESLHSPLHFPVPPEINWVAEEPSSTDIPDFRVVVFEWRGIR